MVSVDVAGRHDRDSQLARELRERAIASAVAAPERPLELDPEAFRAEHGPQPPSEALGLVEDAGLYAPCEQPVTREAREADEAVRVLFELVERDARRRGLAG